MTVTELLAALAAASGTDEVRVAAPQDTALDDRLQTANVLAVDTQSVPGVAQLLIDA